MKGIRIKLMWTLPLEDKQSLVQYCCLSSVLITRSLQQNKGAIQSVYLVYHQSRIYITLFK